MRMSGAGIWPSDQTQHRSTPHRLTTPARQKSPICALSRRSIAASGKGQIGGYIASSSRGPGPGTERDIRRRALDWPAQRDPGPLTSADTVPPGLGTAAPQAALISGLACGHPAGGRRQGHDRRPARRRPGAVHRDRAWPPRR